MELGLSIGPAFCRQWNEELKEEFGVAAEVGLDLWGHSHQQTEGLAILLFHAIPLRFCRKLISALSVATVTPTLTPGVS
jgi:hypothetical protein